MNESKLSAPEGIKSFRADAARGTYLSMDRQAVQFISRAPPSQYTNTRNGAGCRSSKKSTSDGVASPNIGAIKHGSSTQKLVALSSCEAELDAMELGAWPQTLVASEKSAT